MTPLLILTTINNGFLMVIEMLKFAQTTQGQELVTLFLKDRAAWDKLWLDASSGIQKLFSGDLFKPNAKAA